MSEAKFKLKDVVVKRTGDYFFQGVVVAVFPKLSGAFRYVIENGDGVLMIMNDKQLEKV